MMQAVRTTMFVIGAVALGLAGMWFIANGLIEFGDKIAEKAAEKVIERLESR